MRRVLAAAAATLLLAACGGGDDGEGRYDAHVDQVRQAVAAGDRDGALASLEELGTSAFHAHAAGDVTDEELAELAVLLDQARAQVDAELSTTTTAAPTTSTPSTTPPAPPAAPAPASDASEEDDEDDEKGKKKKERGSDGDDGDDDDD